MIRWLPLVGLFSLGASGCGEQPQSTGLPHPPPSLRLAPHYKKYLDCDGIPVVSSAAPDDAALEVVCALADRLLGTLPETRLRMLTHAPYVAVIGERERLTDLPEYGRLYDDYPGIDWNVRARGLGGTSSSPITSASEENILCLPSDVWKGRESIFIHEFAHTILNLGFGEPDDVPLRQHLSESLSAAVARGKWSSTYAATDVDEYFAELTQIWFDASAEAIPTNGVHNEINTRVELKAYDAGASELLHRLFGDEGWKFSCP